jgi:DNA polymerase III epsilon subunit-like protein
MPANDLDYIVFDLETGGLKPDHHEVLQIGAKAYNGRTLEPYPVESGGEFNIYLRPNYPERLEAQALAVNGLTLELLEARGIDQKVGWLQFREWAAQYRRKGPLGAPIACGKNIRRFDLKFVAVLDALYCKGKSGAFNSRIELDLQDDLWRWFAGDPTLGDYSMDTVRKYFGLPPSPTHDALIDARETGHLIMKFLRLYRAFQAKKKTDGSKWLVFEGSCKGEKCG